MRRTTASFRSLTARRRGCTILAALLLSQLSLDLGRLCAAPPQVPPRPSAPPVPSPSSFSLETGEIDGAQFTLARPAFWNNRVLLIAHSYISEDHPLIVDLAPNEFACRTLLNEGWIVAKTSYRRNGIIIADAMADLDALRSYIEKNFGPPERVLIEGESMGGLIATLVAERDLTEPRRYAGVVAIDPTLGVRENGSSLGLSLQPKIPVLFLANQTDLTGPRAYATAAVPRPDPELQPLIFRISRDGHINVNQRERLAAIRALNIWLDSGRTTLPRPPDKNSFFDATVTPPPTPSTAIALPDASGVDARVTKIVRAYGNVSLDAQPSDLAALGIKSGMWFELTVRDQKFRTRYGNDFTSVKRGQWVAFPNADGSLWLARSFADAAVSAGLKLGDTVTIRRFDDTK